MGAKRAEFVHLHNHSEYSLLDGACGIPEMIAMAKEMGMPALALTDHGVMHGAVEFYRAATEVGIKPIIGCEVYTAPRSRFDREGAIDRDPHHLLLLAMNDVGYHNLIQLSSRGHTEGFYYKPRVDMELLERYREGLIVCSACLSGEIPQLILADDFQGARRAAGRFREIFGKEHFFLELQDHHLHPERKVNQELLRMAGELDLPLVASNDTHYLRQSDAAIHDILLCVQTSSRLSDKGRMRFPNDQFYLKSPEEMQRLFAHAPSALKNTLEIAERCRFDFQFGRFRLPSYPLPEGEEEESLLRRLVGEGLQQRYGTLTDEIRERAEHELSIIIEMGFCGYFLIVWDFVDYAKSRQIDVGPGRGSVTGSLVAYALRITEVDPLEYNLLFERFLNPERVSMPDIDIDFCFERRGEVIEYVTQKYGRDHVAQIVTFGTLGARGAVRDIARVLQFPQNEINRIARLIPFELEQTVQRAIAGSRELQQEISQKQQVQQLFELAAKVEGKPRNISMHAAGVVITPEPLTELLPLLRPKEEGLLTQYAMGDLEALGFLKMDFLGLRTLTVLKQAREMIAERGGTWIELDAIPLDDSQTYRMLGAGETDGVFQLESPGMRKVLRSLKPNCIEDIIATNALYRPGPMEHIPEFVEAKEGKRQAQYLHPKLEPILSATYGVLVYQEQVMQIANELAGFSLGQADLLRRAMAKRDPELMQTQRQRFINGAVEQGVDEEVAEKVFELIRPFSAYGFNKSHSAAYGILAYQTAWFKVHYPLEYGAALLSSFQGNQDQIARNVQLMKARGLQFLPPAVNRSQRQFSVEEQSIRFGLLAVRNVGINLVEGILLSRATDGPFRDLFDFCRRLSKEVNKRSLEALIRCGALDDLGERAYHLLHLPEALEQAHAQVHLLARGQTSLLGGDDYRHYAASASSQQAPSFSVHDLQQMELETTGFVFTEAKRVREAPAAGQREREDGGGQTGRSERQWRSHPQERRFDEERGARKHGTGAEGELAEAREVQLTITGRQKLSLDELKRILQRYPGDCPVYLNMVSLKRRQRVPREFWVQPQAALQKELRQALGAANVIFVMNQPSGINERE